MIIGPYLSLHMLLGAVVGWGILSPYAKHRGWAPGDVDDWATGSRGWIIWVSLASLLADALTKLAWLVLRPLCRDYAGSGKSIPGYAIYARLLVNADIPQLDMFPFQEDLRPNMELFSHMPRRLQMMPLFKGSRWSRFLA